jgi:hypothetical protein
MTRPLLAAIIIAASAATAAEETPVRTLPLPGVAAMPDGGSTRYRSATPPYLRAPVPVLQAVPEKPLGRNVPLVLTATVLGPSPAQLTALSHAENGLLRHQGVRDYSREGLQQKLLWRLDTRDTVTSVSLGFLPRDMGAELTIGDVRIVPEDSLPLAEAIAAGVPTPLAADFTWVGVQPTVGVIVQLPTSRIFELEGAELQVRVLSADGVEGEAFLSTLKLDRVDRRQPTFVLRAEPKTPPRLKDSATVVAGIRVRTGEIIDLGSVPLALQNVTAATPLRIHELPARSIEDFVPFNRFGEVFIVAAGAATGQRRPWRGAHLPATTVEQAVFRFGTFAPLETVLTVPTGNLVTTGGISGMGYSPAIAGYHAVPFVSTSPLGIDSISFAVGRDTSRLGTTSSNPVWIPQANRDPNASPTALGGTAMFPYGDGTLMAVLERNDAGVRLRGLVSRVFSSWMDVGTLPIGLPEDATWATGFTDGPDCWLLVGDPIRLYHSRDPLRQWTAVPWEPPRRDAQRAHILRVAEGLMFFGLVELSGRGVVVWEPIDSLPIPQGTGLVPMLPPPARNETRY